MAAKLTRRQQQIVDLAAQGLSNKAIAAQLGIAEQTLKNTLHEAFNKLGINHRVELVLRRMACA